MGNRAVLTIEQNAATHPVAIYVQWNGGLESLLAFMEYTFERFKPRDVYDFHARLCQVIGNYFNDGLSLYCYPASDVCRVAGGCDNGHFHFKLDEKGPNLIMHDGEATAEYIQGLMKQAKEHKYWTDSPNILDSITEAQPKQKGAQ